MAVLGTGLLALTSCSAGGELSPKAAFALSASALSGKDQFAFNGKLSAYNPAGRLENESSFRGEVSGHKPSALVWEGTTSSAATPSYWNHPLSLVSAIEAGHSEIKYVSSNANEVQLEMKLDPETARSRIRNELQNQMQAVAAETNGLLAEKKDESAALAKRELEQSNRALNEALDTLSVQTVCRWTADSRSWFPKKLQEQSVLSYSLSGKKYTEKRVSETNFEAEVRQ